jgi:hypothetical protein
MKFSSAHVIGAGGTGSILLEPLVRLLAYHKEGTKNVCVYDGDEYESSNSVRQLFDPAFVGMNKAAAAAKRLESVCNISAVPDFVRRYKFRTQLEEYITHCDEPGAALVVLAVDSESARNEVIKDLDDLDPMLDFACVLPGNDFHTATCLWYSRVEGKLRPVHPFDVATNYERPSDQPRGSCGYEAVSSPQLINANFASALMTNEVVYALLENKPLPFRLNYSGAQLTLATEGRFL